MTKKERGEMSAEEIDTLQVKITLKDGTEVFANIEDNGYAMLVASIVAQKTKFFTY